MPTSHVACNQINIVESISVLFLIIRTMRGFYCFVFVIFIKFIIS